MAKKSLPATVKFLMGTGYIIIDTLLGIYLLSPCGEKHFQLSIEQLNNISDSMPLLASYAEGVVFYHLDKAALSAQLS